MNLNNLTLFLLIVEKGSLAAAGRELNVSPTTVSDRLAALELHYGVSLLSRTTRAISLTEEGRTLLAGARQLLAEAKELEGRVTVGAQTLSGSIRVSAAIDVGHSIVEPVINTFLADNPQISIELILTDGYVNIVDEGIDIAVRFGDLADSTLRAKRLGGNQRVVCASPAYFARHGKPLIPDDLANHNCLLMRFGQELDNIWELNSKGKKLPTKVSGNRIANDGRLVHRWCLADYGIALKSLWDVGKNIESGELVQVLADYSPLPTDIHILFPPSRTQPLRVREFASKLADAFLVPSIA